MSKLVIEVDTTEALGFGSMAPGYSGLEEHNWTEEQVRWIEGYVLQRVSEELYDALAGITSPDFMEEGFAPESLFGLEDEEDVGDVPGGHFHLHESALGLMDAIQQRVQEMHIERGFPVAGPAEIRSRMAMKGINTSAFLWRDLPEDQEKLEMYKKMSK